MQRNGATSTTTLAWSQLPGTPVAPGGGRNQESARLHAGITVIELAAWQALVGERLGLHFPLSRLHLLQTALARRKWAGCHRSLSDYRDYLEATPGEWHHLADELTIQETSFFRQADVFRALKDELVPDLIERRTREGTSQLRLWSAGCSTGEEAYSLAMTVLEVLPFPWLWDVSVLGTDLSQSAIDTARRGEYSSSRLRGMDDERLKAWFNEGPGSSSVMVGSKLRAITTFRRHNLVGRDWPLPQHDIILCQNVLFYLSPAVRVPLLERLFTSLLPGGYLIVGPAELPAGALPGGARPITRGGILVYRRS